MSILYPIQNLNDHIGDKKKYNYIFLFVLVIFAILKVKYLNTPYHWDEGGVYAPGILKMIDEHTIGLSPNSLESLYSRGHPLMFYFLAACFMKVFGDSHFVAHLFSLIVSLFTLAAVYFVFSKIVEKLFALLLCIILMFVPLFFSMSGLLLPEMMLTLFSIFIFYSLWFQKWFLYFCFGSLAMLTKESAIVWVVFALFTVMYEAIESKERNGKTILLKIFYSLTPILIFTFFIIIQKFQKGWYFFPEHLGYINLELETVGITIANILKMLFVKQGRNLLLWIGIIFIFIQVVSKGFTSIHIKWKVYLMVLILGVILFSAINFILMRYVLFAFPFVIALLFSPIYSIFSYNLKRWQYLVGLLLIVALFVAVSYKNMYSEELEEGVRYTFLTKIVQEGARWIEANNKDNLGVFADFPANLAFTDTRNGYIKTKFPLVEKEQAAFLLIYAEYLYWEISNDKNFTLKKEFVKGDCKIYLFERENHF